MKKRTLQFQITGIAGAILVAACILLTVNSLFSAQSYYGDYKELVEEGVAEYDPALPEGTLPPAIEGGAVYQNASFKFSLQSVLVMVVIVLLGLAAVYWAAGRMLGPLKELARSVQEVDDRSLDKRMQLPGVRGEVLVLEEAFNGMLERLEESFLIQKTFAANAAHELKTPLAVIKSSLQVLEMNPQPEIADCQEFMQDTSQSLDRIIKTVEGLLALANMTDIQINQRVELSLLLEQAVRELRVRAEDLQIELSFDKEEAAFVQGNPELLYRAFYNVIENGVKYGKPGGFVRIALLLEEANVSVRVQDNGSGMRGEDIPHIFEPFYRGDKSRSQQIAGSGLGLAVVKMIVERHQGRIDVRSEPGEGSVFQMDFKRIY